MMKDLIQLQKEAQQIRDAYQTGSVTPKMVGGLASDTLTYISMLEQNLQALGIRKTYATEADMNADTAPMGDNGMPIRFGQLVMVTATGKIYSYQAPGWKAVSDAALPVSIGNVVGKRGDRLGNVLGDIGVADPSVEGFTLNDYTTSGTYRIMGDRTNGNDGMPIDNEGGGHRVDAVLTVLDASISSSEACVTQMLVLSNRVAGDGNMYIRTAKGTMSEIQSGANWETWQKMVGQWEKGMVADATEIDTWTESGMYSAMMTAQSSTRGLTFNPGDTLFVVTINGYDSERLSSSITAQCTQFLYRLPAYYGGVNTGVAKAEQYVGTGLWTGSRYSWGDWKRLADADDVAQLSKGINTNTKEIEDLQNADKFMADALKEKAPKVGYAPDLKVNFAKELVGRGEATPQVIGNIRPTGEISIGDGNATLEKIKGNSVVWNQVLNASKVEAQYDNNLYTITLSNGLIEVSKSEGTSSVDSLFVFFIHNFIVSRKYLIVYNLKRFDGQNTKVNIESSGIYDGVKYHNLIRVYGADYKFFSPTESFTSRFLQIRQGVIAGVTLSYTLRPVIYDLTQMFGEGNEPTTIEEFEARRPLGVTDEYNEGEIISYDGANALQSVGFNAWDEEWEVGNIDSVTGKKLYNTNIQRIMSKDFIQVIPNTEYRIGVPSLTYSWWIIEFDERKEWVNRIQTGGKFTTSSSTAYIQFVGAQDLYGKIYNHDICIHLVHSGYRNGEYKPYEADTLRLPDVKSIKDKDGNPLFPYGLMSAGSADDEITATKAIKRIGVVDLGELEWVTSRDVFVSPLTGLSPKSGTNKSVICTRYITYSPETIYTDTTVIGISGAKEGYWKGIGIRDAQYQSAEDVRVALSGVLLYYELAEPIEVDLEEPLNLTYEAWDFGTEELHTEAKTAPLNADISYQFNAVDRIRENTTKASDLEARIAQLEAILTQMEQANESNEA